MPRKFLHYDPIIKKDCCDHIHCNKKKTPLYYYGHELCSFLKDRGISNINQQAEYHVCSNIADNVESFLKSNADKFRTSLKKVYINVKENA